jgi:hypothetical protein
MFNFGVIRIVQHGHMPRTGKNASLQNTPSPSTASPQPSQTITADTIPRILTSESPSEKNLPESLFPSSSTQEPLLEELIEIACMSPNAQIEKLNARSKILLVFTYR